MDKKSSMDSIATSVFKVAAQSTNAGDYERQPAKFGLIAGVGPLTTVPYYLGIVNGVQKQCAKAYFPRLSIESLSAFDVIGMSTRGQWEQLTQYLLNGIESLAAAGASECAMACVTGHTVYSELVKRSPIPILHIMEPVVAWAKAEKIDKIVILGTAATMRCQDFVDFFRRSGIDSIAPSGKDAETIANIIEKELEVGIINDESAAKIEGITQKIVLTSDAKAVLLGCTELPLIFKKISSPVPVVDPVPLHINAIIDRIMQTYANEPFGA